MAEEHGEDWEDTDGATGRLNDHVEDSDTVIFGVLEGTCGQDYRSNGSNHRDERIPSSIT